MRRLSNDSIEPHDPEVDPAQILMQIRVHVPLHREEMGYPIQSFPTFGAVQELAVCVAHLMDDPALGSRLDTRRRARLEVLYTMTNLAEIAEGAYLRALRFFNQNRTSERGRV
jgi:hypothetical protein